MLPWHSRGEAPLLPARVDGVVSDHPQDSAEVSTAATAELRPASAYSQLLQTFKFSPHLTANSGRGLTSAFCPAPPRAQGRLVPADVGVIMDGVVSQSS